MASSNRLNRNLTDLVCLEVIRGATGSWEQHLRTASSLVPQILKDCMPPSQKASARSKAQYELESMEIITPEDYTASTVLIGSFMWFDILAGASTGSKHFLGIDYPLLLEGNSVCLGELVGCENWVLALIFRISELRNWKKESASNNILSITDLAKRSAEIEGCLQEKLTNISVDYTAQEGSFPRTTPPFMTSGRITITRIFALSALTYLNVIVSGPIPELPEITESVTKTVAEFAGLGDARLLRSLIWPFCVTGCLASEEQRSVFRTLILAPDVDTITKGRCMGVFKLMEECWKRKARSINSDWVSVMDSLGYSVLFS